MTNYYRVMLGAKNVYAQECRKGNFIGVDFALDQDLTGSLPENYRDFNQHFRPLWLEKNPGKSKISAGLACGFTHTVCKAIQTGDKVLCPTGDGSYMVGEVTGTYVYARGEILPHRRAVTWLPVTIQRSDMGSNLQGSTGSIGTVSNISGYANEIETLIAGQTPPTLTSTDPTVEDPVVFALEKHLEDFLVHNWAQTELGRRYDILTEDGEMGGRQYPSDTGPIDLLAISKDKKELLVVELKRGRASDAVVGQIQRYMGFVMDELAESGQTVKGVIIALETDLKITRALRAAQGIEFYRYQVNFNLIKG